MILNWLLRVDQIWFDWEVCYLNKLLVKIILQEEKAPRVRGPLAKENPVLA